MKMRTRHHPWDRFKVALCNRFKQQGSHTSGCKYKSNQNSLDGELNGDDKHLLTGNDGSPTLISSKSHLIQSL